MLSLIYFTKMVFVIRMRTDHVTKKVPVKMKIGYKLVTKGETEKTTLVVSKISSPITNYRSLVIGGRNYVLFAQVNHEGKSSDDGHFITLLHEAEQVIKINDSEVSYHDKNEFYQKVDRTGDKECCVLLYQLLDDICPISSNNSNGEISSSETKTGSDSTGSDCDDIGSNSSNGSTAGLSSTSAPVGYKWNNNSCGPDTNVSLMRCIYLYYFDESEKKMFDSDWPSLSRLLKGNDDSLKNKDEMLSLVYDLPIDGIKSGKVKPIRKKPKIVATTPIKKGDLVDVSKDDTDGPSGLDIPVYGLQMSLSTIHTFLFKGEDPIKKSVYYLIKGSRVCTNTDCPDHNVPFDYSHTDCYIQLKDSKQTPKHSIQERIDYYLSNRFRLRINCPNCKSKRKVENIEMKNYPNLFTINAEEFEIHDKYLPNNIRLFDKNYKLVAVSYAQPNHFVGKFRHTNNVLYDYDGIKNGGKFIETIIKDFPYKVTKEETAQFLFYIPCK